jgi:hypothetical protein
MGPETSLRYPRYSHPWALVHKISYAPMIYMSLYVMILMRSDPLLGQVGGGWALEISRFFEP